MDIILNGVSIPIASVVNGAAIAKALRIEVQDFADAPTQDSEQLCANFRGQLDNVFRILREHGVGI